MTAGLSMTNAIFQGEKESAQQIFYGAGDNAKQDSFELTAAKKDRAQGSGKEPERIIRERDRHSGRQRPGSQG